MATSGNVRTCGNCNACCVYPSVPKISKPAGSPCRFLEAAGHGCQVYEQRPAMCRAYSCAWIEGIGKRADKPGDLGVLTDRRDSQFGDVLIARALWPGAARRKVAVRAMRRASAATGRVALVVADEIEDSERVVRVVGDPPVLAKFHAANPTVKRRLELAK